MSTNQGPHEPLFHIVETDVEGLDRHADAVGAILRRELDGIIIRGAFDADRMRAIDGILEGNRLEGTRLGFREMPPQRGPQAWKFRHLLGMTLVMAGNELEPYFAVAENFAINCRQLFAGDPDFESRVAELLGAVSGGRPIANPSGPDGKNYAIATIRVLPPGSGIELHCDNNLAHHPSYRHLKTLLDINHQMSYFVPISAPESGGELVLYEREWSRDDDADTEYVYEKPMSTVAGRAHMTVRPGVGDLLIFAGGTIYHEVTKVVGPGTRRTIGGFLARSLDDTWVGFWS
jgi:hypothetical protein